MKAEQVHIKSHHKTFEDAIDRGLELEDVSRGKNTFILLAPKEANEKYARLVISKTRGIMRGSHGNDWILIWSYGE